MEAEHAVIAPVPDGLEEKQQATGVGEGEDRPERSAERDDDQAFHQPPAEDFFRGNAECGEQAGLVVALLDIEAEQHGGQGDGGEDQEKRHAQEQAGDIHGGRGGA